MSAIFMWVIVRKRSNNTPDEYTGVIEWRVSVSLHVHIHNEFHPDGPEVLEDRVRVFTNYLSSYFAPAFFFAASCSANFSFFFAASCAANFSFCSLIFSADTKLPIFFMSAFSLINSAKLVSFNVP